ncbi:pyridoxal phosphate-dependent transferase [Chytriomyces sp. MP71]|nr:pyridoxal phosphate-dependent transferase [Chytriomyces sp. MP71]
MYGTNAMTHRAPKDVMPDGSMDPKVAKQLISDHLSLDGNPKLNMASFVTTFMDQEAEELMIAGMRKNFIDLDEYEQTADLQNRCVAMIANLFNAPATEGGVPHPGTGTIGSSEAIMLCVLAMKWRWRKLRQERGLPTDKPNIVFGSNVQVCWHKACRYFEVEALEADVSPDCLVLTADRAKAFIDENTIGVCPILGSTFNGEFEDVKAIHDMVVELNEKNGWAVPIHVDAASGGFIAPFTDPDLLWDFRLPNVKSINVSGHKFGLVYAGIGWAVWREPQDLPEELVFHVNYLGGDQASFTLNFSKGASTIIGQYYNFIRLGKAGYRQVMQSGMHNADYLRRQIAAMGIFDIVDKAHMPLVAFALKDASKYTVFDIQDRMKHQGWIIPAYTCSKGAEGLTIMRVVVKQNFSHEFADMLVHHLKQTITFLENMAEQNLISHLHEIHEVQVKSGAGKKLLHSHSSKYGPQHHRSTADRTHGVC